ncbi:hypothetical protein EIP86_004136 [Pleurotus ostreatoroseus]|nr:hypothetical protein EIP86_004136 [Pleurotus ostreatoroseus]
MNGSASSAFSASSRLGDCLARLPLNQPNQWDEIESTAQSLANDLRVRDIEQQTALGKTLLPQTLTSLLKGAIDGAAIPAAPQKGAIFELLRVGANLCMDHNDNRSYLEDAGFPHTVVSLLEGYAEQVAADQTEPLALSLSDLKIVKTAVGVLLNSSVGYEPIKDRLVSLEAPFTILKLAVAIYPPGAWIRTQQPTLNGDRISTDQAEEVWTTRVTLSQWAWRTISELSEDGDEKRALTAYTDGPNADYHILIARQLFNPDALPYLVRHLSSFIPPYSALPTSLPAPLTRTLVEVDYDALEESCGIIESMAMDNEEVRLSLARGINFPEEHGGVPCLADMLAFVDRGDYPLYWADDPERATYEKGFDRCKAAIIKSIVELAGEEKNTDVLWDESDPTKPGGAFVDTMVQWIRKHKSLKETERDDLIICATLSIGNLVRHESHSTAIINPPIALAPELATLLEPEADLKVKHGVISLLKHLAQAQNNRSILGKAGIVQKLAACNVFGEKADVVDIVQISAIGVAKHLCNTNADNTLALVLPDASIPQQPTALAQIMALVRRSDSIAVKSEGTRVIVNAVKSLWTIDTAADPALAKRKKEAMDILVTPAHTAALAQLIGRSRKYPVLINEGVMALSLMSTHTNGGLVVIDALLNPLPSEAPARGAHNAPISAGPSSTDSPAVGTPRRALDMLVASLRNTDGKVPVEVRANICALVGHLGRAGVVPESRAQDVQTMKESMRELLVAASKETGLVGAPAKKALDAWA